LNEIGGQAGGQFEDMKVIKDLIDYQFEEFTIKAFYIQFIVYLVFYIIPLVLLVYTKSRINQTIYITSCLSIQAVIAVIEAITIKQKGLKDYASDMWNKVDLSMLILNVIFFSNLMMRDPHE
jgi:cytochrome c biogenesis factor